MNCKHLHMSDLWYPMTTKKKKRKAIVSYSFVHNNIKCKRKTVISFKYTYAESNPKYVQILS